MAIRVEFYAEDQAKASSIVEFALSLGAVLQSYSEVAPPLVRGPHKAGRKKAGRKAKRLRGNNVTMFVKCVSTENTFQKRGARFKACKIIMKHRTPILYSSLVAEIASKLPDILDSNVRKTISIMIDNGQLVITHT